MDQIATLPNTTTIVTARRDYAGIQYLRALAASMIVIFHTDIQIARAGLPPPHIAWLTSGVDIFFVISGFIMWVTTAHQSHPRPTEFWRRRIRRIVPLYWLTTSFLVAALVIAPSVVKSGEFDWWHVVASFLFIPAVHPVTGQMQPVVIAGWSLNYEMFFYLIFGCALFLGVRWRIPLLLLVFGALLLLGGVLKPESGVAAFYTSPIIVEFVAGILIGWIATNIVVNGLVAIACAVIGAITLPLSSTIFQLGLGPFATPLSAALFVCGIALLDSSGRIGLFRLPHLLGDASYSIYITHGIVLSVYGQIWQKLRLFDLAWAIPVYAASSLLVACIVGALVYFAVETPLLGKAKGLPQSSILP